MGSFAALPYPHINPVFLEFGPLQFRWYGLMYLIGLTAAPVVWRRYMWAMGVGSQNRVSIGLGRVLRTIGGVG